MRPTKIGLKGIVLCCVAILTVCFDAAGPSSPPELIWERTGGPLGGLGYDIRVNFTDTREWYVTDAYGGFHYSTDDGMTWQLANAGIDTRALGGLIPVFSATVDPHDTNIIWLGTQAAGDIFKSTDRGRTWTKKINGIEPDPNLKRFYSIRGFTVDPRTSDIVYAMAEIASEGWTPDGSHRNGIENDMTKGVVYKTMDGGESWTEIWRGDNLARYCWIDPRNPDTLFVSTGIFDREAANTTTDPMFAGGVGILKSIDGGHTWDVLNQANGLDDLFVGSLFMHPTDPDVLLAAASQNNWSRIDAANPTGGIYRTVNGGGNWERVLGGPEVFAAVEICTSNPQIVYAGSRQAIYRSEDGGLTWRRFGRADGTWGSPGVIAGWPIDMQCDPEDPMRIFANNYLGGNFLSNDGGATSRSVSQGYTGAQVRNLAVVGTNQLYVGGRSGIFWSADAGSSWTGLANPAPEFSGAAMNEVMSIASHPGRPLRAVASVADIASVLWTATGGNSWKLASGIDTGPKQLVSDPSHENRFYAMSTPYKAGGPTTTTNPSHGLWVSQDAGESWSPLSSPVVRCKVLSTVAIDPHDGNVLYAADFTGGQSSLLKSVDRGQTWNAVGAGLPGAIAVLTVAVNPALPSLVFAGLAGGSVYRSVDGGLSFVQSAVGLDAEGTITSIRINPKWAANPSKSRIFIADFFTGVFMSADQGLTWHPLRKGLDFTAVNALDISPDGTMLYAAVEGGGVYRMGLR